MYIHSAHGVLCAYCVFIQYGSELRMGIIKTFEHQHQSADDCLRIFVYQNKQLQWVSDMYTLTFPQVYVTHTLLPSLLSCMFPCCKSRRNTTVVPDPATLHCGWRCDRKSMAKAHACMFIQARMHANSNTES